MALTRKLLRSMGSEDEKIDQIIDAHTETVNALKDERDELRDAADRLEKAEAELARTRAALDIVGKAHALLETLSESTGTPKPPQR